MKLVIAEKPSVPISIAKVIGANKKKDGYYEGNGYRVSWCVGHLIQMANPDAYDEKYAKWNLSLIHIFTHPFQPFHLPQWETKSGDRLEQTISKDCLP